jgi:hypothetical protein
MRRREEDSRKGLPDNGPIDGSPYLMKQDLGRDIKQKAKGRVKTYNVA